MLSYLSGVEHFKIQHVGNTAGGPTQTLEFLPQNSHKQQEQSKRERN